MWDRPKCCPIRAALIRTWFASGGVIAATQDFEQAAHFPPPGGPWPGSRPFRAFDVGQVFDPARHLLGHLASGAEAIGEGRDEFECEMFFRGHLLSPLMKRA